MDRSTTITRRALVGTGAVFCLLPLALPAAAEMGEGPRGGEETDPPQPKAPPTEVVLVRDLTTMRPKDLTTLQERMRYGQARVAGFSPQMSISIVTLAYYDKSRARRLLRDMAALHTRADRVTRLRREIDTLGETLATIEKSTDALRARHLPERSGPIKEQNDLHFALSAFQTSVIHWSRHPMEGTLP
ncbi:MAG: hypothetical protein GC186_02785 [Rhodobacteraceae bacterium]|nr:hypothetical protein [Paracoccaceae bacterium]